MQNCTLSQINEYISETWQKLRDIRKNHSNVRKKILQSLSEEYSNKGNASSQHIIQTILERENIKKYTEIYTMYWEKDATHLNYT